MIKKTRNRYLFPSLRSIHLLFDLGTILGANSFLGGGYEVCAPLEFWSKNRSGVSKNAFIDFKMVSMTWWYYFWIVETTRSPSNSSWALRYINFNFTEIFTGFEGSLLLPSSSFFFYFIARYYVKSSVKLKLLYLRAQEELDGLLVVSTFQKWCYQLIRIIFRSIRNVSKSLGWFFDQISKGPRTLYPLSEGKLHQKSSWGQKVSELISEMRQDMDF